MNTSSTIAENIATCFETNNWTDVSVSATFKDVSWQQAQQKTIASANFGQRLKTYEQFQIIVLLILYPFGEVGGDNISVQHLFVFAQFTLSMIF